MDGMLEKMLNAYDNVQQEVSGMFEAVRTANKKGSAYLGDLISDGMQLSGNERFLKDVPNNTFLDQFLPQTPPMSRDQQLTAEGIPLTGNRPSDTEADAFASQPAELDIGVDSVTGEPTMDTFDTETTSMGLEQADLTETNLAGFSAEEGPVLDGSLKEHITKEVSTVVQNAENGIKKGWDKGTEKWTPHESPEGGLKTIAYGHKFATQAEQDAAEAEGWTEAKAQEVFTDDMSVAEAKAKKEYDEEYESDGHTFEELDDLGRLMLTEVVFNIGSLKKNDSFDWPNLSEAVRKKDMSDAKAQLSRTYSYTNKEGKKVTESLTGRVDALKEIYDEMLNYTKWSE